MGKELMLFYQTAIEGVIFQGSFTVFHGPMLVMPNPTQPWAESKAHLLTAELRQFKPTQHLSGWWITGDGLTREIDINFLSDTGREELALRFGLSRQGTYMRFAFSESEAFDFLCDWVEKNQWLASRVIEAEGSRHFLEWLHSDFHDQVVALRRGRLLRAIA
ncbi:MAG: hypothetical protein C5B58_13490 [Acidobacteria bacterium]|nr:MAG: hypothetical protein C5B58_13490 [Acidobacteriota bacterium]